MSLSVIILGILTAAIVIVMMLFVLFGQITVRKLRKNPETKNELGSEFMSGWDIINVALSLAMPTAIMRKLKKTKLYFFFADDHRSIYEGVSE